MLPLPLTGDEQRAFHRQLRSEKRDVRLQLDFFDLDRNLISSATENIMAAEMTMEPGADRTVDRALTLTLHDPGHRLGLSSNSPTDVQVTADRIVRAVWSIRVDEMDDWVRVPVFTGPVTKVEGEEGQLNIEAQGKERLAIFARGRSHTIPKGATLMSAYREVMTEWIGEHPESLTRIDIPSSSRLRKPVPLGTKSEGWVYARHFADLAGGHTFYDGRGDVVVRRRPGVVWAFDHMDIVKSPGATVDNLEIVNRVIVKGARVQGKPQVTGYANLPRSHPHSAHSLGRNGVPRYLLPSEEIQDDSIRTTQEAEALAQQKLDDLTAPDANVEFEALVIPHLEPEDLCTVPQSPGGSLLTFRNRTLRMGLLSDGTMTVGHTRKGRLRRARR